MQETISGFKEEGSWEEVVRHGEQISRILQKHTQNDEFHEWDEWRPREHEDLGDEVARKTVEKASVDPDGKGLKKKSQEFFREFEEAVYSKIVSRTNPLYFDNQLVSANIEKKGTASDEFTFEIKVHPKSARRKVRRTLN